MVTFERATLPSQYDARSTFTTGFNCNHQMHLHSEVAIRVDTKSIHFYLNQYIFQGVAFHKICVDSQNESC